MNLQAMTKEKLQFLLPVVFTVGPDVNQRGASKPIHSSEPQHDSSAKGKGPSTDEDHFVHDDSHLLTPEQAQDREDRGDALMKYAMLLADAESTRKNGNAGGQHVENIVKGIIEGETRVAVSSMTMEEIFTGREGFKKRIFTSK